MQQTSTGQSEFMRAPNFDSAYRPSRHLKYTQGAPGACLSLFFRAAGRIAWQFHNRITITTHSSKDFVRSRALKGSGSGLRLQSLAGDHTLHGLWGGFLSRTLKLNAVPETWDTPKAPTSETLFATPGAHVNASNQTRNLQTRNTLQAPSPVNPRYFETPQECPRSSEAKPGLPPASAVACVLGSGACSVSASWPTRREQFCQRT